MSTRIQWRALRCAPIAQRPATHTDRVDRETAALSAVATLSRTFGRPDLIPDDLSEAMPAGGILHDYVCWAVQETCAPAIFHLGAILPAWALTLARWGWSLPHRGKQVGLQTFLIGAPASAKSTALKMAVRFHREFAQDWDGDSTVNPWLQAEGTVAGLLEHLSDCYDHELETTPMGLYHSEAGALLGRGPEMNEVLMQLFDVEPSVDRQLAKYRQARAQGQKPPSRVVRPAISGTFAATHSAMERVLTAASFEGGLVSRSLWFTGQADMSRFFEAKPSPEDRRRAQERWTHLGRALPERGLQGGGKIVRSSAAGKLVLMETLYPLAIKAAEREEVSRQASLMRGMNLASLIAALYALSCGRTEITADDMQRAVRLVTRSLETVGVLIDTTVDNAGYRLLEKAERAIRAAGADGITRTDLNRHHLRVSKGELDQVAAQLEEERGITTLRRAPTGKGRGRPVTVFVARDLIEAQGNVIRLPVGSQAPSSPDELDGD